jgi:hypothetical protein
VAQGFELWITHGANVLALTGSTSLAPSAAAWLVPGASGAAPLTRPFT